MDNTKTVEYLVPEGRRSLLHQPTSRGASVAIHMDSRHVGHTRRHLHNVAPSLPHYMQTTESVLPGLSRSRCVLREVYSTLVLVGLSNL